MGLKQKQDKVDLLIGMCQRQGLSYPKTCGALLATEEACDEVIELCYREIIKFTTEA